MFIVHVLNNWKFKLCVEKMQLYMNFAINREMQCIEGRFSAINRNI